MKKILIPVAIIIILVVGIVVVYFANKTDYNSNANQNINIEPLTNAGPSILSCDANTDCEEICDPTNECLIPSCTKNPTKPEGTCVCFDTCGGN